MLAKWPMGTGQAPHIRRPMAVTQAMLASRRAAPGRAGRTSSSRRHDEGTCAIPRGDTTDPYRPNPSGPGPNGVPNQRAKPQSPRLTYGGCCAKPALSGADSIHQCLPDSNQRLLVCRAARRFLSRRTRAVGRPDRIGTSPEDDVSRSRSLPPPGGPLSRDDPRSTIEPAFGLPASTWARRCAHRALGRELIPVSHATCAPTVSSKH
jgi:hypothetical protein